MAFYVAVCLVAALAAIDDDHRLPTLGIIWGTTIGLALAHLFAFRLATRLVGAGRVGRHEGKLAVAQLLGAAGVAAIATVPVLVLGEPSDVDAARLVIAGFIGYFAFEIGRNNGAGRARSTLFAGSVLVIATTVALVKNYLLGH